MVGLSLLTLVPGLVGGSETYARELTRALARVGGLEYRVFAPTIAPDAGDGLPTTVVPEYRARRTTPGRVAAMARAALAPRRLRHALKLASLDAIHFPLSVMLPPVDAPPAATTVLDVQHEVFPEFFSRAELAYRRRVYGWTVRKSRIVITISEHEREALVDRLGRALRRPPGECRPAGRQQRVPLALPPLLADLLEQVLLLGGRHSGVQGGEVHGCSSVTPR